MKTSQVDESGSFSPEGSEENSPGRKNALPDRPSAEINAASDLDGENLAVEMARLAEEVEGLEEENNTLAKKARGLKDALLKKRAEAQEVFERSDRTKKNLVGSLARKRGLLNEIAFFEKEKSQLFKTYEGISERLQSEVSTLDRTLKDMGFFKGEVQALADKMGMLEGEVPVRYRDMDNLDERIKRTFDTLKSCHSRMQRIEKTIKETYYMSRSD